MPPSSLESVAALLRESTEIVVFSGAGLSADSGIPTFRDGATGLWNQVDPDTVASIQGFRRNPQVVWSWLLQLKKLVDDRCPNAGHQALARLEEVCASKSSPTQLTVITQNIDGYHTRAGNQQVLEIHGTIHRLRCQQHCGYAATWEQSAREPFACPRCGAPARPDLVLFGEMLEEEIFAAAEMRSLAADLFFCVGTSFTVQPAALLPLWAKRAGATVVEVNPHPTPLSDAADYSIRSGASPFFSALCAKLEEGLA